MPRPPACGTAPIQSAAGIARSLGPGRSRTVDLRLLSFHSAYHCRHSGACCTAGWIDPREDGRCHAFDPHADGSCSLQRAWGEAHLPHACQQFPRVVTLSPLGVSLSLSAFCPSAAALLFGDEPFHIVEQPEQRRRYEGLDAQHVLPPLLRDGMLMDWPSVARWETLTVDVLSDWRFDPDAAFTIAANASRELSKTWRPSDGSLEGALAAEFARARQAAGVAPSEGRQSAAALSRYLAGHAFACWAMYDGRGIQGALAHLVEVRRTVNDERARLAGGATRARELQQWRDAFRQSDLRLRHRVEPSTSPA